MQPPLLTSAFVKDLERVGRDWQPVANVCIASEHLFFEIWRWSTSIAPRRPPRCERMLCARLIYVPGEFGPLVFVDRVGDVGVAALDQDFATSVLVAAGRLVVQLRDAGSTTRSRSPTGCAHQATECAAAEHLTGLGIGAGPELVDEVDKVVEFDLAGRVDRDGLERLSDLVVGPFPGRGFGFRVGREGGQDSRFRQATSRVEVDLAEGAVTLRSVLRLSKLFLYSRVC